MIKSSLLRTLRQVYKIIQLSQQSGIAENELLDMVKEEENSTSHLSRRHLLRGGVALAGLSATSALSMITGDRAIAQSRISPVLVVGAGISGLTVAYRLRQAGVPVNVIEASKRIGGRTKSVQNVLGTSITADLGGEFVNTDNSHLLSLARELDLKIIDMEPFHKGLTDTLFFEGRKLSIEEVIRDFTPIAKKISTDLKKIKNFKDYTSANKDAIALDRLSISEYLETIPTSSVIRNLIKVAYTVEYGREADEQSALNMLYLISSGTDTFQVTGDSDERFYIDGGNEQIPHRLAEFLLDSIETETVLESIQTLSDGRYRVSTRSGSRVTERIFERIILAIPFSCLRQVRLKVDLPPVKRLAINTLGYGTNAKLITGYREKFWQTHYQASGDVFTDLDFQDTWETAQSRYTNGVGLLTNLTGGKQGVKVGLGNISSLTEQLVSQLDQIFSGIKTVHLIDKTVRSYWSNEPYIQGSYACYLTGQWTQFHGAEQQRVGNLFFAGDSGSLENQGFMEGACETGEEAATAILQDLGLKSKVG